MKKQKNAPHILPREEWPYEVPENWVWTRLENVLESVKEKTDSFNASLKYVGLENIEKDTGTIDFQFADEVKSTKTIFGQGNILYGRLRPYLNKHGLVPFDGICSTDILVFNSKEISLNQFVDYYFHLPIFIEHTVANSKGINLPRVTESTVLDAKFPLPPRPEQQRIVARIESLFSKLDAAAEKIRTALDQCPIRKAALLHKAFTGELTKKWREEHGVGMDSWKETTLGEIATFHQGIQVPLEQQIKEKTPNSIRFIRIIDYTQGHEIPRYIKKELIRKGSLVNGTEIVMVRYGATAGFVGDGISGIIANNLFIIDVKEEIRDYIKLFLKSPQVFSILNHSGGSSAMPAINFKSISSISISLPTNSEQKEIVSRLQKSLGTLDTFKETAERLLETIALTKKSILARAFRGLLGTNNPKEKSAEGLLKRTIMEE